MWTKLKQLWFDPDVFDAAFVKGVAWFRMLVLALGASSAQGLLPGTDNQVGKWIGWVLVVLSAGIKGGDKTPSLPKQIAALKPSEKAIVKSEGVLGLERVAAKP